MSDEWRMKPDLFGHYRLMRESVYQATKDGPYSLSAPGILVRLNEIPELIDYLKTFYALMRPTERGGNDSPSA
jgi:hypothetical protein